MQANTASEPEASKSVLPDMLRFLVETPQLGSAIEDEYERSEVESWINYWSIELQRVRPTCPEFSEYLKETLSRHPGLAPSYFTTPPPLAQFQTHRVEGWKPSANPFRIAAIPQHAIDNKHSELKPLSRPELAQECVSRLKSRGLLIIIGSVGSGKHALVHSDILGLIKHDYYVDTSKWVPVICSPGRDAMSSLAGALRSTLNTLKAESDPASNEKYVEDQLAEKRNPRFLIVVEHFEEIFKQDSSAHEEFCKMLIAATERQHKVLIVLRSNYLDVARQISHLKPALRDESKTLIEVPNLSSDELRNLLEVTARDHNVVYESGLVDTMLDDVAGDPAALVSLRFTMMKLWDRIDDGRIYKRHYLEVGRTRCFEETAEEVYLEQTRKFGAEAVKSIWMELVKPDSGSNLIFERRTIDDMANAVPNLDRDTIAKIVDALSNADLIHKDSQGAYTFAHPVLAPRWPKLVTWVNESRRRLDLTPRAQLAYAAQLWEKSGRPLTGLYIGKLSEYDGNARSGIESEFLAASRSVLRKTKIAAASVALGSLMVALGLIWHRILSTNELVSQTFRVQAQRALLADRGRENPSEAVFWLSKARTQRLFINPIRQAGDTLAQELSFALPHMPVLIDQFWMRTDVRHAEFHPVDSRWIIMVSEPRNSFAGKPQNTSATGATEPPPGGSAVLWRHDPKDATHEVLLPDFCSWATFSPDGTWLAVASREKVVVWEIQYIDPALRTKDSRSIQLGKRTELNTDVAGASVRFLTFDCQSRRLAASVELPGDKKGKRSSGSLAYVWTLPIRDAGGYSVREDAPSLAQSRLRKSPIENSPINHLAFNPTGTLLALSCGDIWKGEEGLLRLISLGEGGSELTSKAVLRTDEDLKEIERDPAKKEQICIRPVIMASFSPDGRQIVVATGARDAGESQGGAARLIDIKSFDDNSSEKEVTLSGEILLTSQKAVMSARFSPDGGRVLISTDNRAATVSVNATDVQTFAHQSLVFDGCYSPDGAQIATAGRDGVRVWKAGSAESLLPRLQHPGSVVELRYSPDGRHLLAVGDKFVRVWSTAPGTPAPLPLNPAGKNILSVFTPDLTRAVAGSPGKNGGIDICYWRELIPKGDQKGSAPNEGAGGHPKQQDEAARSKTRPDHTISIPRVARLDSLALSPDGAFIAVAYSTVDGTREFRSHLRLSKLITVNGKLEEEKPPRVLDLESPIVRMNFGNHDASLLVTLQSNSRQGAEPSAIVRSCSNVAKAIGGTDPAWSTCADLKRLSKLKFAVSCWEVTDNDRWLLVGTGDANLKLGIAYLVPLRSDGQVIELKQKSHPGHQEPVTCIAIDGHGKTDDTFRVVSGSRDDTVILWKIEQNEVSSLQLLDQHPADVTSVSFDQGGQRVLSTSKVGSIVITDISSNTPRRANWMTNPNESGVLSAMFSPDREGSMVLSVSADRQAKIWDPKSGRALGVLAHYPKSMIDKAIISQMNPLTVTTVSNVVLSRDDGTYFDFPELRNWKFQSLNRNFDKKQDAQIRVAQVQMARSFDKELGDLAPTAKEDIDKLWNSCREHLDGAPSQMAKTDHHTLAALAEASGDWFSAAWRTEQLINERYVGIRGKIIQAITKVLQQDEVPKLDERGWQDLRFELAALLTNRAKVTEDEFLETGAKETAQKAMEDRRSANMRGLDNLESRIADALVLILINRYNGSLPKAQLDQALKAFQNVFQNELKPYHRYLEDGENWRKAGDLWMRASEWARALQAYDNALQAWPDDADVPDRLAIMVRRARCHLHLSRLATNKRTAYLQLVLAEGNCKDAIDVRARRYMAASAKDRSAVLQIGALWEMRAEISIRANDIYNDKSQPPPDPATFRKDFREFVNGAGSGYVRAFGYLQAAEKASREEFDRKARQLKNDHKDVDAAEVALDESFNSRIWQRLATLRLKIERSSTLTELPNWDKICLDSLEALRNYAQAQNEIVPSSNQVPDSTSQGELEQLGDTRQLEILYWAWVLAPSSPFELSSGIQGLEKAIEKRKGAINYLFFLNTLGAAYYRVGRHNDAIRTLKQSCDAYSDMNPVKMAVYDRDTFKSYAKLARGRPQDWALLSMAHTRRSMELTHDRLQAKKDLQEARLWLALAQESVKSNALNARSKLSSDRWIWNGMDVDNLLHEAEKILNATEGAFDSPPAPAIQVSSSSAMQSPQPQAPTPTE